MDRVGSSHPRLSRQARVDVVLLVFILAPPTGRAKVNPLAYGDHLHFAQWAMLDFLFDVRLEFHGFSLSGVSFVRY